MKDLIVINGTMGVGKSATAQCLLELLQPAAYLDGDWCWTMKPFVVSDENKSMVMNNIVHVLRSYLSNSQFQYVVFTWVLHRQEILTRLFAALADIEFRSHLITLECSDRELKRRLESDIRRGLRGSDVISRSLDMASDYAKLDTVKLDVTNETPWAAATRIAQLVKEPVILDQPTHYAEVIEQGDKR